MLEMFLYQHCFVYSSVLVASADQTPYTVAHGSSKFWSQIKNSKYKFTENTQSYTEFQMMQNCSLTYLNCRV